jgi:hypothetical protein
VVVHIFHIFWTRQWSKTDIIVSLISIIRLKCIKDIILIIYFISQVCVDLGIADHFWQEKRSTIATTIDGLGDKFKPELRAGWLAYMSETYPDGQVAAADRVRDGLLEVDV